MKIALGSDHAGYALKEYLARALRERSHEVSDCGTFSEESVDYPDFAATVGSKVAAGAAELGVVVCGTGIGVGIAANKIDGIRAATCNDLFTARLAREHNNANVLALGARVVAKELAQEIVETFLDSAWQGGRHARRVEKINALD